MRITYLAAGALLTASASGINTNLRMMDHGFLDDGFLSRLVDLVESDSAYYPDYPQVPEYNFNMPVDHFDDSNTDTYQNRYFVNDTYYEPGGPVLLLDFGEAGVSPAVLAHYLAESNGTISVVMRLAEELHGVVIAWEHRYYGYSLPVEYNGDWYPEGLADGYKYLTTEQALEDVAYFANRFNETDLEDNNVIQSTAELDPYHTPWIFVGGSYPGMRAAWARLTHPEIFYASWSSSAPVQAQADGSIWYNPIVRSLPSNCSSDFQTAVKYADTAMSQSFTKDRDLVIRAILIGAGIGYGLESDDAMASFYAGYGLEYGLSAFGLYQSLGPASTTQRFCDYMESFDVEAFAEDIGESFVNVDRVSAMMDNPGGKDPTSEGIAASARFLDADKDLVTFGAMIYGMRMLMEELYAWGQSLPPSRPFTQNQDGSSWTWQTVTELGFFVGTNVTDSKQDHFTSRYYNVTVVHTEQRERNLVGLDLSGVPRKINNTYWVDDLAGWNMQPSNVMFTNGEFDTWRAFSVSSEEERRGAPMRTTNQDVPACNKAPKGSDVFGLVYPGAVHAEDLAIPTAYKRGSREDTPPLEQGLALFLKAWDEWAPCFDQSRDDIRNGKGVDGEGESAKDGDGGGDGEGDGGGDGGGDGDGDSAASSLGGPSSMSLVIIALLSVSLWL